MKIDACVSIQTEGKTCYGIKPEQYYRGSPWGYWAG